MAMSRDKFGNDQMLVNCKPNKNGYPTGYFEMGGKLYKVGVSNNLKDGGYWVTVTKKDRARRSF